MTHPQVSQAHPPNPQRQDQMISSLSKALGPSALVSWPREGRLQPQPQRGGRQLLSLKLTMEEASLGGLFRPKVRV